jgi:hypothetical protein
MKANARDIQMRLALVACDDEVTEDLARFPLGGPLRPLPTKSDAPLNVGCGG